MKIENFIRLLEFSFIPSYRALMQQYCLALLGFRIIQSILYFKKNTTVVISFSLFKDIFSPVYNSSARWEASFEAVIYFISNFPSHYWIHSYWKINKLHTGGRRKGERRRVPCVEAIGLFPVLISTKQPVPIVHFTSPTSKQHSPNIAAYFHVRRGKQLIVVFIRWSFMLCIAYLLVSDYSCYWNWPSEYRGRTLTKDAIRIFYIHIVNFISLKIPFIIVLYGYFRKNGMRYSQKPSDDCVNSHYIRIKQTGSAKITIIGSMYPTYWGELKTLYWHKI